MALKISNHFMYLSVNTYLNGKTIKGIAVASNGAWDPGASDFNTLADISANITSYEFDGANYARPTLAGQSVTESDANDNVVTDYTDATISSLGAGTNPIEGWIFYVDGADDDNRFPIGWFPYSSAETPNGNDFTLKFHADGLFKAA